MTRLLVRPAKKPLSGSVPVPSDKSIGHRALIVSALSSGDCRIERFSYGEDNVSTMSAFRSMGVSVDDDGKGTVIVHGVGLSGLSAPATALDCGNSGTTMRLLAGVLAAQPFASTLVGDASLSRRPMGRIARPLRARGATVEGSPHPTNKEEITPPLTVGPVAAGQALLGLEYRMPMSSAQVKSCLLLSGLFASGPTTVYEPIVSRDHTERMLASLGLGIEAAGPMVRLEPPGRPDAIPAFDIALPGDLSSAAFVVCAAQIVAGSHVSVRDTNLNPTRAGILDVIRLLGGTVTTRPAGETLGEAFGEVTAKGADLRGGIIAGEVAVRSIDEIPIACALGARARGTTTFSDVGDLRVKESNRIAVMVEVLRAFGIEAVEEETGITMEGCSDRPLRAARVQSHGDHRVAMTAAVLGLVADGETVIEDVDCIATSFPRFVGTLRALGADIEVAS